MYKISTDSSRNLVILTLIGMLTAQELTAMYAEETAAVQAMGCNLGEHIVLADLTEYSIQTQDISAAIQRLVAQKGTAKRVAMVTGSSLAKMQARRIAISQVAQVFTNRATALEWLMADAEG